MKKAFIILFTLLVCCSCGSTKVIPTIPVETVKEVYLHDTLVVRDIQFDSIYIYQSHDRDFHPALETLELGSELARLSTNGSARTLKPDTVFVKDVSVEYRYQMLRDTIERVKIETIRDSIPYEVKIIETKEVPRPLTWFDHLTRACFRVLIGVIFVLFVRFVFNNKFRVL